MATMVVSANTSALVGEFREEAKITRRSLERVPEEKLSWRPHPKSMTLGQLAWHVATIPAGISRIASQDSFDVLKGSFVPSQPGSLAEILNAYEQGVVDAENFLSGLTEQRAAQDWTLFRGEKKVFTQPRMNVVRTIMLNHWYHHRGQLSVYLRLLDVAVPVIYGRSADEDPFA
jgi:uncharacterized damage-inducible protein DinB